MNTSVEQTPQINQPPIVKTGVLEKPKKEGYFTKFTKFFSVYKFDKAEAELALRNSSKRDKYNSLKNSLDINDKVKAEKYYQALGRQIDNPQWDPEKNDYVESASHGSRN